MNKKVLILGGTGRIGSSVAQDLLKHTDAEIIATGRSVSGKKSANPRLQYLALDLDNLAELERTIAEVDLVAHCAGPFHHRDGRVLQICLQKQVNYVDVSDHRSFYNHVVKYRPEAEAAGVTAILNTGIFPGISNSMVRQGVEQFDEVETIHLSYVVAGSGGAGLTVMRTTFLGLQKPFSAWLDGQWQEVLPYSDRETVSFPQPYGKTGVYWFDMPETYTFAESFKAKNIITKFGSVPDFYNHLTWIAAHVFPKSWITSAAGVEFLSRVSYQMTAVTDKFSGIGVAIRSEVQGHKDGKMSSYCSTLVHENTATSAGCGTGSIAQLLLAGKLHKPGIWAVEQALPTNLFEQTMTSREIEIKQQWLSN
ncbi:MAG: saccharopine dehydrogenase NADP-binding domain-containing protein [Oscillatoria sp. PMC 1068.18]|nr:saccharopine dehydrogenase NADP-binding domain-containing protein [Oscillatoria sp. PMC 1076.18]MEC4988322.1 saccharopine dehydrogenase NADP-binding domain-containing protein [Oscillatoria sp. PMC 1068.18]